MSDQWPIYGQYKAEKLHVEVLYLYCGKVKRWIVRGSRSEYAAALFALG